MKELYPVRLNGVGLNAIDARFHVADVEEEGPKIKVTTQSLSLIHISGKRELPCMTTA